MITSISLGLAIAAFVFSGITAVFSILAYSEVVGLRKSTHRIEWQPIDPEMKTGKEFLKEASEGLLGVKYKDDDLQF